MLPRTTRAELAKLLEVAEADRKPIAPLPRLDEPDYGHLLADMEVFESEPVSSARYGVSSAELLVRAGARKLVGGLEDQLIDIALELRK